VQDCISAMLTAIAGGNLPVNIFNLGTDEYCSVDDSLGWICEHMGVRPKRVYAGGERGWVGDSPLIFLDAGKIRSLGWRPTLSIKDSVLKTVDYLSGNSWLFDSGAENVRHESAA
jgi:UDP-glucose 4-epimerase